MGHPHGACLASAQDIRYGLTLALLPIRIQACIDRWTKYLRKCLKDRRPREDGQLKDGFNVVLLEWSDLKVHGVPRVDTSLRDVRQFGTDPPQALLHGRRVRVGARCNRLRTFEERAGHVSHRR